MKIFVNIERVERTGKKDNLYNVTLITVYNEKGNQFIIQDFNCDIPFSLTNLEVTISKNEDNRYIINELGYTIPWNYYLAVNMLLKFSE